MSTPMPPKPFNLLRRFSVVSMVVVAMVATLSAYGLSKFFVGATLERDAWLSAQFIEAIAEDEMWHANFGIDVTIGELLDARRDDTHVGLSRARIAQAREKFYDHVRHLPDALLVNVFAPDGAIVLSSNPELVGLRMADNDDLEEVLRTKKMIAKIHPKPIGERVEQRFVVAPEEMYVENYIPLRDARGNVGMVIEIYKEPRELLATLDRGRTLIWLTILASAAMIYAASFWIVRHGSQLLRAQQRQLVENDTLVAMGELASAIAHGLRNPLASIRTSAELAMDADVAPIRKNLDDIVTQVDRLSKWVRELLMFSRPLNDDWSGIDLYAGVSEALRVHEVQMQRAGIELQWQPEGPPPHVVGHPALLLQALNSVLSNAVEAMRQGGRLSVSVAPADSPQRVALTICDTGTGMTETQLASAFKVYFSTKRSGLGIGLPLVKRIMERFGGSVEIESRENAGTKVRLIFVRAGDEGTWAI